MRFPRNAKIFRGQLDVVPLVGVLFLLLIFILLGSLVYTPGIPIKLTDSLDVGGTETHVLTINENGVIVFAGRTNGIDDLDSLAEQFKAVPPRSVVILSADLAAPRQVVVEVSKQIQRANLTLEASRIPIRLPDAVRVTGTQNAVATVAVNLGGQFFFENKMISPTELQGRLSKLVAGYAQPITLVVLADESVEQRVIVQLTQIAKSAGIAEMQMGTRPPRMK